MDNGAPQTSLTVAEARKWLEDRGDGFFGTSARLLRTGFNHIVSSLGDVGEMDIDMLMSKLSDIERDLVADTPLNAVSLRTYVSRTRRVLTSFKEWAAAPATWSPPVPRSKGRAAAPRSTPGPVGTVELTTLKPTRMSLQDEVDEAFVALARWPNLRPYILPGLMKAMNEAARKSESDSHS